MLLDLSNLHGEHSSLDDIERLRELLAEGAGKRYDSFSVQNSGLSTLGISSSLASALQRITSLTASHNRISTLQGVEAFPSVEVLDLSHNALRVLDAHSTSLLRRLQRLRRCDFSHNEIRLIDLDSPPHSGSPWGESHGVGVNAASTMWEELVELNLSHNQLIEVPDLRCMPLLEVLHLEHNRIEYIADVDKRLPLLALGSLFMAYNALSSLQHLVPLTVFAETLKTLTLMGNPCVSDTTSPASTTNSSTTTAVAAALTKSTVRSWLLWLLPHLERIDNMAITFEERQIAAHLFRHKGKLSYDALTMMNSHREADLGLYLQKIASAQHINVFADSLSGVRNDSTTTTTNNNALAATSNSVNAPAPSLGGMTARLPVSASAHASVASNPTRPISSGVVLQMMQRKLKKLSDVMEVLWKESMARRVFATIVIQKYSRGFLTRSHLPPAIYRVCARIRGKWYCNRRSYLFLQYPHSPLSLQQQQQQQQQKYISNSESNNNAEIVRQIKFFDSQLRHMWSEMNELQRLMARKKNAAAITIQKYYRGYMDRKQWGHLKESYDGFIASLRPHVVFLQRVCRGYLIRRKLSRRYRHIDELRFLRTEVAELRQAVRDMQALTEQTMRRQRLHRYTDPEKAME